MAAARLAGAARVPRARRVMRAAGLLQALRIGAVAAAAVCTAGPAAAQPAPPVVAPGTWVILGSSSAAGYGATPGRSWAARLQADYAGRAVTLVNLAIPGATTYAAQPAAQKPPAERPAPDPAGNIDAALARSPSLLIVSYPTNDTAAGYGVDETVRNLLSLRDAARARGVPVIVLSTQPRAMITSELARLPQIDARLAQALGPCFVAVREPLATSTGTVDKRYDAGDGVHVNDDGHALVLARVREVIDGGGCVKAKR